ncbi:MAG: cation:proton antiporter, partial [Campylobacterales bacterium]|nr:cation:proton antiporter [Campylobacterales bacterium]
VEAIVTLLLGISILKMTIIFLIYWYELGKQISFETSLALFQMGEFGLVIFELAKGSGLISGELSQIVIATIILSMTVTPFVIKKIASLHGQALK